MASSSSSSSSSTRGPLLRIRKRPWNQQATVHDHDNENHTPDHSVIDWQTMKERLSALLREPSTVEEVDELLIALESTRKTDGSSASTVKSAVLMLQVLSSTDLASFIAEYLWLRELAAMANSCRELSSLLFCIRFIAVSKHRWMRAIFPSPDFPHVANAVIFLKNVKAYEDAYDDRAATIVRKHRESNFLPQATPDAALIGPYLEDIALSSTLASSSQNSSSSSSKSCTTLPLLVHLSSSTLDSPASSSSSSTSTSSTSTSLSSCSSETRYAHQFRPHGKYSTRALRSLPLSEVMIADLPRLRAHLLYFDDTVLIRMGQQSSGRKNLALEHLPPRLRFLELGGVNAIVKAEVLSEAPKSVVSSMYFQERMVFPAMLEELYVSGRLHADVSLPPALRHVRFPSDFLLLPANFPQSLEVIENLPFAPPPGILTSDCLHTVEFQNFQRPLLPGVLPNCIRHLRLGDSFNHPISDCRLPQQLSHLALGAAFNQRLDVGVLPSSLRFLSLGLCFSQALAVGSFNAGLQVLCIDCETFNQPLVAGVFPSSLRKLRLNLGTAFNRPLRPGVFNEGLTELFFYCPNVRLVPATLPSTLVVFCIIRGGTMSVEDSYHHAFTSGVLPRGLRVLGLHCNDFPLESLCAADVLPLGLQVLSVEHLGFAPKPVGMFLKLVDTLHSDWQQSKDSSPSRMSNSEESRAQAVRAHQQTPEAEAVQLTSLLSRVKELHILYHVRMEAPMVLAAQIIRRACPRLSIRWFWSCPLVKRTFPAGDLPCMKGPEVDVHEYLLKRRESCRSATKCSIQAEAQSNN